MRHVFVTPLRILFFVIVAQGLLNVWSHAQTTKGAYTTTADVPLRSGPGNYHEVITTLPKGININVVGKEGFWLKVESKHGGKPGYIDEQFAKPLTASAAAQISASTNPIAGSYRTLKELDLREGPGTKYPAVARIPADVKVNVIRAEGDWLRVESRKGGKPGYLDKRDVERWRDR